MNWLIFICAIALFIIHVAAAICLAASYAASRPTPPLFTTFSTRRQPGETDSDLADRLLNASPFHKAAMKGEDK